MLCNHRQPPSQHARAGQALVLLALTLFVLLGFSALAVDVAFAYAERRLLQNAVDAAALAGARALYAGQTDGQAVAAAQGAFEQNLLANHDPDEGLTPTEFRVEVNTATRSVRVTARANIERFFLSAFSSNPWSTTVQAAARVGQQPTDYAFLVLEHDNPNAVNLIGNVGVRIVGGSAMSNGGMRCVGNGTFQADGTVDAALSFSQTGNCRFLAGQGVRSGLTPVDDPLATMPEPPRPTVPSAPGGAAANCTTSGNMMTCPPGRYSNTVSYSGNGSLIFPGGTYQFDRQVLYTGNGSVSLGPGFYYFRNGFSVGGNATVTLAPGTYVFESSSFAIGGNVRLVLQGQPTSCSGSGQEFRLLFRNSSFAVQGNFGLQNVLPCDVLVYLDNSDFALTGNTDSVIPPGLYYFDGGTLRLQGNQTVTGQDVLFFFGPGSAFNVVGNTRYVLSGVTDPAKLPYPNMQPGLVIFQARGNSHTLRMVGNSGAQVNGILYLPNGTLELSGNASGTWARGQLIVYRFATNGNTNIRVERVEHVMITRPAVWLIE
ncbi:pilus assembly protein TadG-related protein [Thermomicrobium sp. CFH 73360]|uniref:pilus assembly protein TadG-related protein n=1 Tax=Thermomicrobium sp. CFH 73360 TaxID=2951987 RepID=UPI0020772590|nr:pilus assembly protein TadG-related protein [Thermomicrobium sp. CFH 73360]MCM8746486.1 pilus assembly protein TadG-related protein [Thermomicrobium sp. CFH 73360]